MRAACPVRPEMLGRTGRYTKRCSVWRGCGWKCDETAGRKIPTLQRRKGGARRDCVGSARSAGEVRVAKSPPFRRGRVGHPAVSEVAAKRVGLRLRDVGKLAVEGAAV